MDIITVQEMKKFSGVNNVDSPERLYPVQISSERREYAYPLREGRNMDIDNTNKLSTRPGYSSFLSGADVHSLWAEGEFCFYVDGNSLYKVKPDFSTILIRSGLTLKARMGYAVFNDRVYYSNGYQCGYVQGFGDFRFTDPQIPFKTPLPAGSHIEVFMGCLYVSLGNVLYVGDPLCDYFDVRDGYRLFTDDITAIRAVDTGIYVSDKKTWFLKGTGNEDFDRYLADEAQIIPFTDLKVDANSLGRDEKGNIAFWTSTEGICIGDNAGNVNNVTRAVYRLEQYGRGSAFIRDRGNIKHYINSLY